MIDGVPSLESELRRLRKKYNCSVIIEHQHFFYDFRPEPHSEFRVCIMTTPPASCTLPIFHEAIAGAEALAGQNTPEAKAELMRKNAAELLKQAEELSPTKHEPAS